MSSIKKGEAMLKQAIEAIQAGTAKHGNPHASFELVAEIWDAYVKKIIAKDHRIHAYHVAAMMSMLKIVRAAYSHHSDNYVDEAGYAALAHMFREEEED